jgi:sugar O-acyltransferase (sialic acid O-acetyltransferase NeuD family)
MSNEILCLYGAGGHGRVVASQALRSGWRDVVFTDAVVPVGRKVGGLTVRFSDIDAIEADAVIVCIGDNGLRQQRQEEVAAAGHTLATLIVEPSRYYGEYPGAGTVVLAAAVVNDSANLGEGVIVNSAAVIEHDVIVGAFSHIAPGAVLGGGARVGRCTLVGTNATVMPGVSVGNFVTVGAGAVVTTDIVDSGVYVGVPARRVT